MDTASQVSDAFLRTLGRSFDLESIVTLDMSFPQTQIRLTTLPSSLAKCTHLENLDVSHHALRDDVLSLSALDGSKMQRLRSLNMSHNALTGMARMPTIPTLTELDVSENHMKSIDCMRSMGHTMPAIRHLKVAGNPFIDNEENLYFGVLVDMFPDICTIDGIDVQDGTKGRQIIQFVQKVERNIEKAAERVEKRINEREQIEKATRTLDRNWSAEMIKMNDFVSTESIESYELDNVMKQIKKE